MKITLFIVSLMCIAEILDAQSRKTDLKDMNAKGNVKSINEKTYYAVQKQGEVQKGKIWKTNFSTYNPQGNKIEENENVPDDKMIRKIICKYDANGNKIEQTKYENGQILGKDIYKYNSEGKMTEYYSYGSDGRSANKIMFTYDRYGNLIEKTQYYSDGSFCCRDKYKYDNKGNIIEESSGDANFSTRSLFKYDNSVNWIEYVNYINGKYSGKVTRQHDSNENITEQFNYDDSNKLYMKQSYTYVYDKNSNWIKKIEFLNDKATNVIEREITYY